MPNQLSLTSRFGAPIRTLDEWRDRRKAANTGWVPGKSAWETANAWVGTGQPAVPLEFRQLLDSHELTRAAEIDHGVVERKTSLRYGGCGPRNHDLALWGRAADQSCFIGIESNANDGFDNSLRDQIRDATAMRQEDKRTNQDHRAAWLCRCLLGLHLIGGEHNDHAPDQDAETDVLDLPYQLFAGVAGTLIEARKAGAGIAVFVVHQFRTQYTTDTAIQRDAPRGSPQNRPMRVTSKPANGPHPGQRLFYHAATAGPGLSYRERGGLRVTGRPPDHSRKPARRSSSGARLPARGYPPAGGAERDGAHPLPS